MASFGAKLKHAWNAFTDKGDDNDPLSWQSSGGYGTRPDRPRMSFGNERSIVSSIYNRIALDVASVDIRHVRLDDQKRYLEDMKSGLNLCMEVEANLDQAASAFRQDIVMTLFNEGAIAIVPVDVSLNPAETSGYDIQTLRVARIVTWFPKHIRVSLYNEATGRQEEITLEKKFVAIVENPLYAVMNEPNSTLQRLIVKLNMLDAVDHQSSSGKLDMIIQLPYVIKSEARRAQAEQRRKDLEFQMNGSQYGIAYTDGAEKIVQLNRPAENNLLGQIEYLTEMLYNQLGITKAIMDGTADEAAVRNYFDRTVEPILRAISEAMARSFLTKTARSQGQSMMYFRDPFKLVPMSVLAEIADKFSRNEIITTNELRSFIGMRPSKEERADSLRNPNMPAEDGELPVVDTGEADTAALDDLESTIDEIMSGLESELDE